MTMGLLRSAFDTADHLVQINLQLSDNIMFGKVVYTTQWLPLAKELLQCQIVTPKNPSSNMT